MARPLVSGIETYLLKIVLGLLYILPPLFIYTYFMKSYDVVYRPLSVLTHVCVRVCIYFYSQLTN
jgi:hypothetical protein